MFFFLVFYRCRRMWIGLEKEKEKRDGGRGGVLTKLESLPP
jgi:hypothetical protein